MLKFLNKLDNKIDDICNNEYNVMIFRERFFINCE